MNSKTASPTLTTETVRGQTPVGLDRGASEDRRRQSIRRRNAISRRILAFSDAIVVAVALFVGTTLVGDDTPAFWIAAAFVLLVLLMKAAGLYDRDEHLLHRTTLDEIPALFHLATLSALLLWLGGEAVVDGDFGRRQIFGMWMLLFGSLIVGRSMARHVAARLTPPERCLVLGDSTTAEVLEKKVELIGAVNAELVGSMPLQQGPDTLRLEAPELPPGLGESLSERQVHRVILAPGRIDSDVLLHLVRQLRAHDVNVSVLPATPPVIGSLVETDHVNGLTLLGFRSFEMGRSSRLLKRAFDLITSSLLLLTVSPLLAIIAVAIKLDSSGPVLFRQRRIGRDGRPFEILKFRSMFAGAEGQRADLQALNEAEGLFKIEDDPRITRVGRIIRRFSLDELPQLVNVLRGEMSLVGPRPLVPEEDSMVVGHFRRRLDLAPGITGYWQALGSHRIPLSEMVRLDYLYVATWSLWNDVRILLRTIPYVFGRRGR